MDINNWNYYLSEELSNIICYLWIKLRMSTYNFYKNSSAVVVLLPICAFLWRTWWTIWNVALPKNCGITVKHIQKIRILLLLILANKQGSLSFVLYPIFVILKKCYKSFELLWIKVAILYVYSLNYKRFRYQLDDRRIILKFIMRNNTMAM